MVICIFRVDLIKPVSVSVYDDVDSIHPSTNSFIDLNEIWCVGSMRDTRWYAEWPDPRSRSRSRRSEMCENGRFQRLSPPL